MVYAKTSLFKPEFQELAALYKALSHPARLAILEFLGETATCFTGDITEIIPLSRTTVKQHLVELKNAGLIQGIITGTRTNYCLNPDMKERLKKMSAGFIESI